MAPKAICSPTSNNPVPGIYASCGLTNMNRKSLSQHLALGVVQIVWLPKYNHHSEPKHERQMCVEKQTEGTRACDRHAIRLAYGPSTGTVDLFFRIPSSPWTRPWMISDPPLHVALGPELRRLPVRLL